MEHQTSLTVDPTAQAFHLLTETKIKVLELLQSTPYTNLQVSVENNLNQLINFFRHTTGLSVNSEENNLSSFEPITTFMGDPVHAPTAIDITLLTPSIEETELLKQKILQLESSIENLDNDVVINSYALPEDELVLRGLAKKLELPDYETRPIDYDFINVIRTAVLTNKLIEQKEDMLSNTIVDNQTSKKLSTNKSKKKLSH